MRRHALSRRTVLRGLIGGAITTVALPPLEAMFNSHGTAFADGSGPPIRFMTYCIANGVRLDRWVPSAQGEAYPLSEELAPIANVQDYCSVLSGFQNRCEKQITHHEGMTVFNGYTFVEQVGLFSKAGGPTIDQVIADHIAGNTTFRSIEIGISKRLSIMDSGTTLFYLSHRGTNEPQPPEFNPQALWTKLFGSFVPPEDPSIALRVSVLDSVREDVAALKKRLGQADLQRMDAHLTGLSELEKQIKALPPACAIPQKPDETNADVNGMEPMTSVHTAMTDLLAYAFSCDVSRVASFFVTGGAAETVFSEIGQSSVHHSNTHNANRQEEVHQVVVYNMERFAYLLEKFKATPDGVNGENLLDNMAILLSSDCSEGYTHDIFDMPIVVAGRAGGRLRHPGVHYRSASGENTTDILVSCLQAIVPEAAGTGVGSGDPFSNTPCAALNPV
jgi:hypothetical protein